ncbi:hypothetical protein GCM10011344_32380 [Dokdonia pacifica]|uniref:Tetratricopeptide repeat-containing protein n=1 Tax=Dokdonia pacifica TaxID=1627892 RepID=A0A239BLW7_9FLAO|nr:histidine kinase [Dokdonia pacifica]GGG29060.1 hypothetical protein GCM10011344_32380 [Dokdonia pacifica]SNS08063.1 Tetratricopeptide repeat-containing protein [Dokdonia pacifica]
MKSKIFFIVLFLNVIQNSYSQELNLEKYNPNSIYTQQKVDSILEYYIKNARKIKDYSEIKKILASNEKLSGWSYYYFLKSKQYSLNQVYDSSIIYANKSIAYYEELKNKRDFDEKIMLETYLYKARSLSALKRYDESITNNHKALDYTKKFPYKWKSFIVANIADSHLEIGNDSIALNYYNEVSKDSLYMNLDRPAVVTHTRIGVIYSKFNQLDKAKQYYEKAIRRSEESAYKNNLWILYYNLGDIYQKKTNTNSTLFFYKKALDYFDARGDTRLLAVNGANYLKGYIALHDGNINTAIDYLNTIKSSYDLKEIKTKDEKDLIVKVFATLSDAYKKKNDIIGLQEVLKESNAFLEAFHENQLKINLNNLEIRYQTKEKDTSIASLEEKTKSQQTIISQRNTINWVLSGLLVSFIGLGFLFYRQRQLQNKYRASNLEQRLLRSQLNPHFLFNALNSVSGLVQKKSDKTIPYISKLGNLLRAILENSREEFITLSEEIETLSTYLELQSAFSKKFTFTIEVDEKLAHDDILMPPMFVQPFVENSIQHGLQGKDDDTIVIHFYQDGETLCCKIEDNGVGNYKTSTDKKDHQSLSGTILKERLDLYSKRFKTKAYYTIEDLSSEQRNGTQVLLVLPLIKD